MCPSMRRRTPPICIALVQHCKCSESCVLQLGHFEGGHVSFNAAPDASAIAWLTAGHEVWAVLRQNPGGDAGGGGDGMPTYCAPQKCTPRSTVYLFHSRARPQDAGGRGC